MAPAKVERQVLRDESLKLRAPGAGRRAQVLNRQLVRQAVEPVGVRLGDARVVVRHVRLKGVALNGVARVEDAAAHDVEEHVHAVPGRREAIGRELLPVRQPDELVEPLGARLDIGVDRVAEPPVRQLAGEANYGGGVLVDVRHEVPRAARAGS